MIGSGMAGTFALPEARGVSYLEYFYPGVLVMVVLFTAIFTTMSVIEDRHSGFLQAVLVAPGSRASVVLGKCLGAASVAFAQGCCSRCSRRVAGFAFGAIDWALLLGALALSCFGLCALGFAVAWWLDSTAGYHVVMSVLLLPLWILSGAMFPARAQPRARVHPALQPDGVLGQRGAPRAVRGPCADRHRPRRRHAARAGACWPRSALLAAALSVRVCNVRR